MRRAATAVCNLRCKFQPERRPRIGKSCKAFGGAGAVVTGPRAVLDVLRSKCRTFLFTTALPPMISAGVLAAMRIADSEPKRAERALAQAALCESADFKPVPARDGVVGLRPGEGPAPAVLPFAAVAVAAFPFPSPLPLAVVTAWASDTVAPLHDEAAGARRHAVPLPVHATTFVRIAHVSLSTVNC